MISCILHDSAATHSDDSGRWKGVVGAVAIARIDAEFWIDTRHGRCNSRGAGDRFVLAEPFSVHPTFMGRLLRLSVGLCRGGLSPGKMPDHAVLTPLPAYPSRQVTRIAQKSMYDK